MLFVSPDQINYLMPVGMAYGPMVVKLLDGGNKLLKADLVDLVRTNFGLFTANATGVGVPSGVLIRVKPGNVQSFELISQYDTVTKSWVPLPIDLGPENETVYLALFGTGWRERLPIDGFNPFGVAIEGVPCDVVYLGKQPTFAGLDQLNIRLPRALARRGLVGLRVSEQFPPLVLPLIVK